MSDGVYGLIGAVIVAVIGYLAQTNAAKNNNDLMMQQMREQSKLADANLEARLDKAQAVTDTKLDNLTEEVRRHNNFAQKIPVLEEQIKVANHRIDDLESKAS
jgi:hypothetical protein